MKSLLLMSSLIVPSLLLTVTIFARIATCHPACHQETDSLVLASQGLIMCEVCDNMETDDM